MNADIYSSLSEMIEDIEMNKKLKNKIEKISKRDLKKIAKIIASKLIYNVEIIRYIDDLPFNENQIQIMEDEMKLISSKIISKITDTSPIPMTIVHFIFK